MQDLSRKPKFTSTIKDLLFMGPKLDIVGLQQETAGHPSVVTRQRLGLDVAHPSLRSNIRTVYAHAVAYAKLDKQVDGLCRIAGQAQGCGRMGPMYDGLQDHSPRKICGNGAEAAFSGSDRAMVGILSMLGAQNRFY
jgi:hypothetical protein